MLGHGHRGKFTFRHEEASIGDTRAINGPRMQPAGASPLPRQPAPRPPALPCERPARRHTYTPCPQREHQQDRGVERPAADHRGWCVKSGSICGRRGGGQGRLMPPATHTARPDRRRRASAQAGHDGHLGIPAGLSPELAPSSSSRTQACHTRHSQTDRGSGSRAQRGRPRERAAIALAARTRLATMAWGSSTRRSYVLRPSFHAHATLLLHDSGQARRCGNIRSLPQCPQHRRLSVPVAARAYRR